MQYKVIYVNNGNPISCVQLSYLTVLSHRTQKDDSLFPWKVLMWLQAVRCSTKIQKYSTVLVKMNSVFFISYAGIPGWDSETSKYSHLGTMSRFNHK